MTIGVLDDDPGLCYLLETILMMAGHKTFASTDPLAFVECAQGSPTDDLECMIVDFRLPGGRSGIDVIAQIRRTHPNLPALLISGDPLPETLLQQFPNAVFCRKPFHIATILAAVSHLRDKPETPAT
jgi:DNA-binding NtrC family response regulator